MYVNTATNSIPCSPLKLRYVFETIQSMCRIVVNIQSTNSSMFFGKRVVTANLLGRRYKICDH